MSAWQASPAATTRPARPKLVVGIVIDQMRYDYLTRFWNELGEGGFKRLIREGTQFRSMHYNYVPTATGPGHAAIWTGAYPATSGITNNDFFDRELGKKVYCVEDPNVTPVGSDAEEGRRSPHRLLVTTIGDELKLATNEQARVYAVSLKDRASVLPGGHMADGAYWFDYESGRFITSSFYEPTLPSWVVAYNDRHRAEALLAQPWTLRDPAATYTHSRADDNAFEEPLPGETAPVFPHDLAAVSARMAAAGKERYDILATSPWGNTLVREMAEAALEHTDLGRDDTPDVLAISFSSTDYVGHRFGPASREIEDIYRRLDDDLTRLLTTIDRCVGLDHTVVFLTADHAVAYNAKYLRSLGLNTARTLDAKAFRTGIEGALVARYGADSKSWVAEVLKGQIVLDRTRIRAAGQDLAAVQQALKAYLLELPGLLDVVTAAELQGGAGTDGLRQLVRNGAHATRSGDVFCLFDSGSVFGYDRGGASHSEPYAYDTHVPFLLRGPRIAAGAEIYDRVVITQIAPTLAALLDINEPSAALEGPLPVFGR